VNQQNTDFLLGTFKFFDPRFSCFDCGDGWFELIKQTCAKLQALDIAGLEVDCVKEKFGGLRIGVSDIRGMSWEDQKKVIDILSEAEEKSCSICENCGNKGEPRVTGRVFKVAKTLCSLCHLENTAP